MNNNYQKIRDWLHQHPRLNPKSFTFDRAYRTLTNRWRLYPDFIIIGYHKTATTFLYEYLSNHPNIGKSSKKEVHFFDYSYWRGIGWYKAQFPLNKTKGKFEKESKKFKTGEATPLYSFHPKAAKRIKELVPKVKLIVVLRNPIDRAYSHYQHKKRVGLEHQSFEDAIKEDDIRFKKIMKDFENDNIRDYDVNNTLFPYVSMGKYVLDLKKWMEIFPKEQFLILKTEEINQNPERELNKICNFIEIPTMDFKNTKKKNVGEYSTMLPETRMKLSKIYEQHNKELEEFLGIKMEWD